MKSFANRERERIGENKVTSARTSTSSSRTGENTATSSTSSVKLSSTFSSISSSPSSSSTSLSTLAPSPLTMTAQSCDSISTRPSTPASRIDQWLSERSKHSRPPPHLRVPSTSFVYESKGLSRSFNLPSAPKTPEIASSYLIKGVNTNSEESWESFVKKFATPHTQTVEEMIDEDDEDKEEEIGIQMVDSAAPQLLQIYYKDIPWIGRSDPTAPFQLLPLTCDDIGLPNSTFEKELDRGEVRDFFRTLFLRWHVDKFLPTYRHKLAPTDEEIIRERLNATTARLYQLRDEVIGGLSR